MFKTLRKSKGLTQKELANRLLLNQTTISKWESGKAAPTLDTVTKIAEILGCEFSTVAECFIKQGA